MYAPQVEIGYSRTLNNKCARQIYEDKNHICSNFVPTHKVPNNSTPKISKLKISSLQI